jgi:phage gp36-like protein
VGALIKQPAEELKRSLPVSDAGALVQLVEVVAEARGLVTGSAPLTVAGELTAGMLFVHLAGGSDGERYLVTARVEDAAGEIREAEMEVAVIEAAWITPEGGAGYLSIADFVARYGLEETVRMTDGDGSGRIDRTLLVGALAAAQAIADAHLAARYAVPLTTVPEIVKLAIGDMARARLYPGGAPEGVDAQAKAQLKLLERIATGALPLPALEAIAPAATSTPILIDPGVRRYPPGCLADY